MSLFTLNSRIHQSYDSGELPAFKEEIIEEGLPSASGNANFFLFKDHIGREFNRKAFSFGLTGLMFTPYDAGFRPEFSEESINPNQLLTIGGSELLTIGGSELTLI
jgi:hypothetical protein